MNLPVLTRWACSRISRPGKILSRVETSWRSSFTQPYHWSPINLTQSWNPHTFSNPSLPRKENLPSGINVKQLAYIALGSNLGDRVDWIEKACNQMLSRGIKVKRTSFLWETEPMYVTHQGRFLNGVCEVETELRPIDLLDQLQSIENDLGRKKIVDKGPRNIDLDILLYGNELVSHSRLEIPHPGIQEREFVLRPLSDLIPGKSIGNATPWKIVQDYVNALPPSDISTITPLVHGREPVRCMKSDRSTKIMAILNLTPDSFSDGGENPMNSSLPSVIDKYMNSGASILDFGGQSTKPYATDVSSNEEISRIIPAITYACLQRDNLNGPNIVISVDTYRAEVADAAIKAGADIVNDVSAGTLDPEMLPMIARLGKTVCLTHMRGTPQTMNSLTDYPAGLIPTVARELLQRIAAAEAAGIRRWRIMLDPGIGFSKTTEQNLEILRHLDELREWPGLQGFPWLVGSSRKGFIGKTLGLEVPRERIWGTAVTVAAAVKGGADIVRVHDVKEMAQVVKMSDAIWRV